MNDAVGIHTTTDNSLQRGFSAIWYDFGVYFAAAFEYAKDRRLFVSTAASFAFDALTTEVGFIDFDLAL